METRLQKRISARKLTILLLLATPANNNATQPILGTTRMQKLVFLVSEKIKLALKDNTYFTYDYNYDAEKFGPADLDLYQDLDFLKTMKLITFDDNGTIVPTSVPSLDAVLEPASTKKPTMLPEEKAETELSFDYLMGVEPSELLTADVDTDSETEYRITQNGKDLINKVKNNSEGREKELLEELEKACAEIKVKYGNWDLIRILKFVYDKYPSFTTNSIIRDKITGAR